MAKYIVIPEPVTLVDLVSGRPLRVPDPTPEQPMRSKDEEPMTMRKFVIQAALNDPKFGKGAVNSLAGARVLSKFDKAAAGTWVKLDEEDYKLLKDVIQNPTNGFNPHIAIQCAEFIEAIEQATSSEPKTDKKKLAS